MREPQYDPKQLEVKTTVYLTDYAPTMGELTDAAWEAGVTPIQPYYGGGYDGLPDTDKVRWRAFRDTAIEVVPTVPLAGTRHKIRERRIQDNPVIDWGTISTPFEGSCYQTSTDQDGQEVIELWTSPNDDGEYSIIKIPRGTAQFRLIVDRDEEGAKSQPELTQSSIPQVHATPAAKASEVARPTNRFRARVSRVLGRLGTRQ